MSDKGYTKDQLALLADLERTGIVELVVDTDGSVIGAMEPYRPQPAKRGRGRFPAPDRFRDAAIRIRFAELASDGRFTFRQVPGKANKAAIHRTLADEFGLSSERVKKIVLRG